MIFFRDGKAKMPCYAFDDMEAGGCEQDNFRGFSLMEILVVLVIMGFFAGMVMAGLGGVERRAGVQVAVVEMHAIARAITGGVNAEAGFWADLGVLPEDRHINPGRSEDTNVDGTSPFDPDRDDWIAVSFDCPSDCTCCTPGNCPVDCTCCTPDDVYINGNDYYYAYSLRFLGLIGPSGEVNMTSNYVGPIVDESWALARFDDTSSNSIGFLSASDLEWNPVTGRGWRGSVGEAYLARESCPVSQAQVLPHVNSRGVPPPTGYEANLEAFKALGWHSYVRPQSCPPVSGEQFVHDPGCLPLFLDPWGSPYQLRIPYRPLDVDFKDHRKGQLYRYAYLLSLGPNGRRDVSISGPNTGGWDVDGDGTEEYNAVDPDGVSHWAGKNNRQTDDIIVYCFGVRPDQVPENH